MNLELLVTVILLAVWVSSLLIDRFEERLPLPIRRALGEIDLDDPRTIEEIKLAYAEDRLTESEMERRLEVAVDPRTEQIRNAVEPVSGIGPETALNIASEFESERDLQEASTEDLKQVPNVGPKRADAIRERL